MLAKMKTLKFNNKEVKLNFTTYRNNGMLAVQLAGVTDDEFYDIITVNLNCPLQSDRLAFVDENNLPGIGQWLQNNGIAYPIGYHQRSGFCSYPLYSFHIPSKQ